MSSQKSKGREITPFVVNIPATTMIVPGNPKGTYITIDFSNLKSRRRVYYDREKRVLVRSGRTIIEKFSREEDDFASLDDAIRRNLDASLDDAIRRNLEMSQIGWWNPVIKSAKQEPPEFYHITHDPRDYHITDDSRENEGVNRKEQAQAIKGSLATLNALLADQNKNISDRNKKIEKKLDKIRKTKK